MFKKRFSFIWLVLTIMLTFVGCSTSETTDNSATAPNSSSDDNAEISSENMVLISGGTFIMGSPENEPEREADESQHQVTVSDFYMAQTEVTQAQYQALMGSNPSDNPGDKLPVTNVTWYDAIAYCNALSQEEGLIPAYTVDGQSISWDRSANGYRLPTEAEWEYACRADTTTPFSFGDYVEDSDANCYNAYGYNNDASGNWVNDYIEHTVDVASYAPNTFKLYDLHGNAAEWVWDWYGEYSSDDQTDPTGVTESHYKIVRGGGWNDFPKNIRSAYRSAFPADVPLYSIGFRPVRNAQPLNDTLTSTGFSAEPTNDKVLIAYFSATGNTKGLAEEIASQIDADIFRIERVEPYRNLYSEALTEQRENASPQLASYLEDAGLNIDDYDTILLGYSNWWASIPASIRTFTTHYDLSGKTIIPFCSHGGGVFGQSISAVAKLTPDSIIKKGLNVHYSSYDDEEITKWLAENGISLSN